MAEFDFKNPDYEAVYAGRRRRLAWLRSNPEKLAQVKAYYRLNPADFINDWGMTYNPLNVGTGIPPVLPFVLFPKQREWVQFVLDRWRLAEASITEKTREVGASWLAMGLACTLALHYDSFRAGFGSRKEEYVDKPAEPKSLFWKGRFFLRNLPRELRGGWDESRHAPQKRLIFPDTHASISGEVGDNIGRGDRTSIYFVDEAAHLEHPMLAEAALSATTNCRVDFSSVNGMGNPFAQKRWSGRVKVFSFGWRDDPRKDEAWYAKKKAELDAVVLAQEIDMDYTASVRGIVIPGAWVRSAIDAHKKLGITITGRRSASLDVADEGPDLNAFCGRHGILLESLEEWSGSGGDIFETTRRALELCDDGEYETLTADGDGLGAGVRGDARVINDQRQAARRRVIGVTLFRGSAGVERPEAEDVKGRKNKDYFQNRKAQAWWKLRTRFEHTHKAVNGEHYDPDELISIPSELPLRERLLGELSQPTYQTNGVGKIVINKTPEGTKSPNLADAVMIEFSGTSGKPIAVPASLRTWAVTGAGRR